MSTPEWLSIAFFPALALAAWLRPALLSRRLQALAIALVAVGLLLGVRQLHEATPALWSRILRDLLPGLLLLLAYWQSGRLFGGRHERLQRVLERWDDRHGVPRRLARWSRGWLGWYWELAYLLYYPLVPFGVIYLYLTSSSRAVVDYWTVVLLASYPCYLVTALARTSPPWIERSGPQPPLLPLRRLNLWILRRGTGANMFPSAHVAAPLAGALLLVWLEPAAGLPFLFFAASIGIGAVAGRYHYALDVAAGAASAVAASLAFLLWPGR